VGFLEVSKKRSSKPEQYSRAKLLRSLLYATDHLAEADVAFALADTIETNLLASLDESAELIASTAIAKECMAVLKRFDTRAYVKYLSYQTNDLDARQLKAQL
jgi:transcriptional regulator NrdR family protein